MVSRFKNTLALIAFMAGILCIQGPATACGTVQDWIMEYERGHHHKALFHLLDCASGYIAPEDDIALLPIIADALKRNNQIKEMAGRVFRFFNCLYGARNQKAFQQVFNMVSKMGKPLSLDEYSQWMVVRARSGANMRAEPSLESRVLTSIQHGMLVRRIDHQREWVKVVPAGPGSIDPRYERVVGYIHDSLLKPY